MLLEDWDASRLNDKNLKQILQRVSKKITDVDELYVIMIRVYVQI